MIEQFYDFQSIAFGVLKILLLASVGYALRVSKLLKKEGIDGIGNVLVWAALPALMITKITGNFEPAAFKGWWLLPISAIIIALGGLAIGYVFQKPLKEFGARREFMGACAFQNSGYLPMTLVTFICSGVFCDKLLVLIFLFLIGYNLILWSLLPPFLSPKKAYKLKLSSFINAPLTATVLSVISVFLFGTGWMPEIISDPLKLLGNSSFPLALITLGAYLAEHTGHMPENWKALISAVFAKLIAFPAVVFMILKAIPMEETYKFLFMLEAAMPSAVTLVIIGYYSKADNKFLSGIIFYTHLLSVISIPVWLYVFKSFL